MNLTICLTFQYSNFGKKICFLINFKTAHPVSGTNEDQSPHFTNVGLGHREPKGHSKGLTE